jgi:hypothetical protein
MTRFNKRRIRRGIEELMALDEPKARLDVEP